MIIIHVDSYYYALSREKRNECAKPAAPAWAHGKI